MPMTTAAWMILALAALQEGAPGRFPAPGFGTGEHVVAVVEAFRKLYPRVPPKTLDELLSRHKVDFDKVRLALVGRVGSDAGWTLRIESVIAAETEVVVRYRFFRLPVMAVQVPTAVADAVRIERSAKPVRFELLPPPKE